MNETNNIEALSHEAIVRSKVFAEYYRSLESALRSTDGKAIECTKAVYEYGITAYADVDAFMAVLDDDGIKLKGGYNANNHFLAVVKLLAKLAGIPLNTGELARIAATCLHAYGMGVPNITAYIEQMGGVRKAYEASANARRSKGATSPDAGIDTGLHLQIHSDAGFQGILDVPPDFIDKLMKKWGVKAPVTDVVNHPAAANDNEAQAEEVTHG